MSAATMTAVTVSRWTMGRNVSASSPFPTPLLCRWFRAAVLPLDRELETALFHRLDAKRCAVCGALFTPGSNRAKYCPECAVQVRRRKEAERQRKRYYLSTHLGLKSPCKSRLFQGVSLGA